MTTVIHPREMLWTALWKSSATEVLVRRSGDPSRGIDLDHPLLKSVDRHLDSIESGVPLRKPDPEGANEEDPEVAAYLSLLHHRMAHAVIAKDAALQQVLATQLAQFKYGNPAWQEMQIQYALYYGQYPYHRGAKPQYRAWRHAGHGNLEFGTIAWRLPADATVVIIGDIGTGTDVAAGVLKAALSFKPDAILHLGDVYYSGTSYEVEHCFTGLLETVFTACGQRVPVFTVPGNHEYFTGAVAFLSCLDSGRLAVRHDQQQSASYFCLRSADDGWQFLGMDTGFNGHAMGVSAADQAAALQLLHAEDPAVPAAGAGEITVPTPATGMVALRDDELEWHRDKLRGFAGRSILLSHHQLYSAVQAVGVAPTATPGDPNRVWVNTAMWGQLGADFGDRVAAWIWGHEHNLGIYEDGYRPSDWPANGFPALSKGRCAGHAAIPVGESEAPYAQTYPVPLVSDGVRLGLTDGWYNRGFEVLKLHGAGKPADLRYFQVAGADPRPLPVYEEAIA
jgi:3',5'-cyclic AMP phosphodiesterase CpdA